MEEVLHELVEQLGREQAVTLEVSFTTDRGDPMIGSSRPEMTDLRTLITRKRRVVGDASKIRPADPLGMIESHSGACLVARRVALDHPERVAGLILEASPTTLRGHAGLSGFVESVVSGLEDPISPDFARSVVNDTSSDRVAPELLDQLVEDLLKVPARVWRAMFTDLLHYDDTAELNRISVSTLLLWGDGDAFGPAGNAGPTGEPHPRYQPARLPRRRPHSTVG